MPLWNHRRWMPSSTALLLVLASACSDSTGSGPAGDDVLYDLRLPDVSPDVTPDEDAAPDAPIADADTEASDDIGDAGDDASCTTWYRDGDSDGLGDATDSLVQCDQPDGYVANPDDCDDGSAEVGGTTTFYLDDDGDGFGDPDVSLTGCEAPEDYVADGTDCADGAIDINPDTVWYRDSDEDGFGNPNISLTQCEQPDGYILDATDCTDNNGDANPDAVWYFDADRDLFGDAEGDGTAQCLPPGRDFTVDHSDCNDHDPFQNPDSIWYRDLDGDGFGDSAVTIGPQCEQPTEVDDYVLVGGDCVDNGADDAEIFPGRYDCPFAATGTSCLDIFENGDPEGDGIYAIDPDGDGGDDPFLVFCDMSTDGGGWTALMYPAGYRVPAGVYLAPGVSIALPNNGTSQEGWIEGTGDGCPGNVPGATTVQGWYGYSYVKCGDLTIQMSFTWQNVLGATDVRFGAALQGTPHRANQANDQLDDYNCDSTPDDDDVVDTSPTYDADRDDYCGRREIVVNGAPITEAGTLVGSDGNATTGVQSGECGYWNGGEAVPASFPTVTGEQYIHPNCLSTATLPDEGLQVEQDALAADEDLTLRLAAGRGCWPNCGWNEGILVWGLSVR